MFFFEFRKDDVESLESNLAGNILESIPITKKKSFN